MIKTNPKRGSFRHYYHKVLDNKESFLLKLRLTDFEIVWDFLMDPLEHTTRKELTNDISNERTIANAFLKPCSVILEAYDGYPSLLHPGFKETFENACDRIHEIILQSFSGTKLPHQIRSKLISGIITSYLEDLGHQREGESFESVSEDGMESDKKVVEDVIGEDIDVEPLYSRDALKMSKEIARGIQKVKLVSETGSQRLLEY